ncbi:hypothetical protein C5S35_18405 [Candidatus Methanophagaceae archaeon]|jgi:hypothetical protein|nr:hypothetical protein C5S35_18405 [Methanophagales archaeon]
MEKIVEIGLKETLLRDLENIAIRYGITKERWIKEAIIKALRSEKARAKIMKIVSEDYIEGEIEFEDMTELIGIENAKKIRAVAEGAKRSIEDAFHA